MAPLDARCLEAFPVWLKLLAEDARKLAAVIESPALAESARKGAATALNYLFKSLDLIPDGLEDLGFVDDALVFRVASRSVPQGDADADPSGVLVRLSADAALVEEFLGELYPKLAAYVAALESSAVRGRSAADIVADAGISADFTREVRSWADGYAAPAFLRDDKNLVKLRAFLGAKLK
jgi:uncharacterized membrane protein YkvA (DUF1232 family)